jgi:phosphohistidine phosphatase
MPSLYLLRHVKSSWAEAETDDFDRGLAPRGERAAGAIAAYIRQNKIVPDLVLCSAARRTRDTFAGVRGGLPRGVPLETTRALYEVGSLKILRLLHRVDPGIGSLLVIGHNPGMEGLAGLLAGPKSDPEAQAAIARKYPSGGLAHLEFEGTWADLKPGSARLVGFVAPKDLV